MTVRADLHTFSTRFYASSTDTAHDIDIKADAYCATHYGGEPYEITHVDAKATMSNGGVVYSYEVSVSAKGRPNRTTPPPPGSPPGVTYRDIPA